MTTKTAKRPRKPAAQAPPEQAGRDAWRVQHVDPRTLELDPCNHRKGDPATVDAEFIAMIEGLVGEQPVPIGVQPDNDLLDSVARNGVDHPITVRPRPGGKLGVVAGQCRWLSALADVAAQLAAGRDPLVPVLIREDLEHDDAAALVVSMNENAKRTKPARRDTLGGVAQLSMLLEDAPVARRRKAAKALGLTARQLDAAAKANSLSDARLGDCSDWDMVELAEYAEVQRHTQAQWKLRQARNDDRRKKGTGRGNWAHALQRLRDELADADRRKEAEAALTAAGVTVLTRRSDSPARPLDHLRTGLGKALTTDGHKECPGHAAYLDEESGEPVWMCADWKRHGHHLTPERAAAEKSGQGARSNPEERRKIIAYNKAWKASQTVRRKFVTSWVAGPAIDDATWTYVLSVIMNNGYDYSRFVNKHETELIAQFLGIAAPSTERAGFGEPFAASVARTPKTKRGNILLAHVAAATEYSSMGEGAWRHPDRGHVVWLTLLQSAGYELSEIESEIVGIVRARETAKSPERPAIEAAPQPSEPDTADAESATEADPDPEPEVATGTTEDTGDSTTSATA